MPNLPMVQQQTIQSTGRAPRASAGAFGAGSAAAVQGIGRSVQQLGAGVGGLLRRRQQEDEQEKQKRIEKANTSRSLDSQIAWSREYDDIKVNTEADGIGHVDMTLERYDTWIEDQLGDIDNQDERDDMRLRLDEMRSEVAHNAIKFESSAKVAYEALEAHRFSSELNNRIANDPSTLDVSIASYTKYINSRGIDQNTGQQWIDSFRSGAITTALTSDIKSGPIGAQRVIDDIDSGKYDARVESDTLRRIETAANGVIESADRTAVAQYTSSFNQQVSNWENGVDLTNNPRFSNEQIDANIKDPEARTEMKRRRDAAYQLSGDYQKMQTNSQEARMDALGRLTEQLEQAHATEDPKRIAEASNQIARFNAAYQKVTEQISADPAGYALNDQSVSEAYRNRVLAAEDNDLQARQQATDSYAEATIAFLTSQGLNLKTIQLLPSQEAEALRQSVFDYSEGPEKPALAIQEIQREWGQHSGKVFQQIFGRGGVPVGVDSVANMPHGHMASMLAKAIHVGRKEIEKAIDKDDTTKVVESVTAELGDFTETTRLQGSGLTLSNRVRESAELLALQLVQQGKSTSEAAEDAVSAVADDLYFYDGNRRTPRTQFTIANKATIDRGIEAASNIGITVALPDIISGNQIQSREINQAYHDALRDSGVSFITNEDESGVYLVDALGNSVKSTNGPIELSWEKLKLLDDINRYQEILTNPSPRAKQSKQLRLNQLSHIKDLLDRHGTDSPQTLARDIVAGFDR
jgi:hypothetical protein